jgi:hypothetical protein
MTTPVSKRIAVTLQDFLEKHRLDLGTEKMSAVTPPTSPGDGGCAARWDKGCGASRTRQRRRLAR